MALGSNSLCQDVFTAPGSSIGHPDQHGPGHIVVVGHWHGLDLQTPNGPWWQQIALTSPQTLATIGPRTQYWPSALALAWTTSWPNVTVQSTQIRMFVMGAWYAYALMATDCELDPRHLCSLWWKLSPPVSIRPLAMEEPQTQWWS